MFVYLPESAIPRNNPAKIGHLLIFAAGDHAPVFLPKIDIIFLVSQECLNHAEENDYFLYFIKVDP